MTPKELLRTHLDQCPLIAIIRGVRPEAAEAIELDGERCFLAGIQQIAERI